MPVSHGPQIEKFSAMCGCKIPSKIKGAINRFGNDQESIRKFGIEYATKQCEELLAGNVLGLHFYTLNKTNSTQTIFKNLGIAQS